MEVRRFHIITEITFLLHILALVFIFSYGIDQLLLGRDLKNGEYKTIALVLLTWMCIYSCARFIEKLEILCHRREGFIQRHKRAKNHLTIGFSGTLFFGFLPKIAVFFTAQEKLSFWYSISVGLGGIGIFFLNFINNYRRVIKINHSCRDRVAWVLLLIQGFFFITSIRIALTFEQPGQIIACQALFSLVCVVSTTELSRVVQGKFKFSRSLLAERMFLPMHMMRSQMERQFSEAESDEPDFIPKYCKMEQITDKIECKICMEPYSDSDRVPRILKECGHTCCEACVDKLASENKSQHVFCPFCQDVTIVKGPGSTLPKNWTILDLMNDMEAEKDCEVHVAQDVVIEEGAAVEAENHEEEAEPEAEPVEDIPPV